MQVERLVETWQAVKATRSRLAKTQAVSDLLAATDGPDVAIVVSYLSGELPQGRIGLGWSAIGSVEATPAPQASLTVAVVDETLTAIQATSGAGSKKVKAQLLHDMFSLATEEEQDFLERLLLGGLRQGALVGVMADAVAKAADVDPPLVRRAAMVTGDLAQVATAVLTRGASALDEFGLELFTAVQPMLAQTATSVAAALEKIGGRAAVEWKVDGVRVQVHRRGQEISVFTRNLRDITQSAPDVARVVLALDVESIILDGEAVALRHDEPVAFQETMSRFATGGDGALNVAFFDCLHLNGRDLIDVPDSERWAAMQTVLPPEVLIPRLETGDTDEGQQFFDDAIEAGYEGVMVKALDATYDAGKRGAGWLKVKPVHTLDLVVLAVEWGSGRRSGWLSNIHLGARDPENPGSFVMLGKTFKGMTDEILQWQTERFLALETHRDGHIVHVRPEQVVEVAVDGIQSSSRYPGGVALRFARVKGYRSDKVANDADTIETVRALG